VSYMKLGSTVCSPWNTRSLDAEPLPPLIESSVAHAVVTRDRIERRWVVRIMRRTYSKRSANLQRREISEGGGGDPG
jgi:hypothetical protein